MPITATMANTFLALSNQYTADLYDESTTKKVHDLFRWLAQNARSFKHLKQTNPGDYRNTVVYFNDGSALTAMSAYPEDRIDLIPGTSTGNFKDPARVTIQPEGPAAEAYFSEMRLFQSDDDSQLKLPR